MWFAGTGGEEENTEDILLHRSLKSMQNSPSTSVDTGPDCTHAHQKMEETCREEAPPPSHPLMSLQSCLEVPRLVLGTASL